MINPAQLRLGNYLLYKNGPKINAVACSFSHFDQMAKGDTASFFPVVLKPEWFERSGFIENREYALLPDAREFVLLLPVQGSNTNAIHGFMKNNKECFARATVNDLPVSRNVFTLHELQNLYYSMTGDEMPVK